MIPIDPLSVKCPYCRTDPGERCIARGHYIRKPHVSRARLARAVAADADPALDAWFPKIGPCGICGIPGLNQRHRVVDAIADALRADEDAEEELAADYRVPVEAVRAVGEWAAKWEA